MRFHVFLAVTSAALLGWWSDALICRARSPWRWAGVALLIGGMLGETAWTRDRPERWGRTNLRYPEYEELCAWMAEHARGEPTLANFGLSGGLAAYADVPVILHPKFEDATIRRRVEEYGRRLFRGTEAELRDWAEPYGARRLVYARGEFAEARPEYQMRYMVDALRPPNDAAARGLEFRPRELNFFVPLWENRKYRVFRVVTRADEATAAGLETAAQQALARGETARAEELAWKSLAIQPRRAVARRTALHAAALRRQGVRDATHPTP